MPKEMFISSSPHETKLAVLDDEQLVEVYYERDTDVGLVGGIHKGRVSRVLPGMQSAFVDIGLERDAFLYVSDFFFEDQEDYDKIIEEAETRAVQFTGEQPAPPPAAEGSKEAAEPVPAAPAPAGASPAPAESTPVELPPAVTVAAPAPEAAPPSATSVEQPPEGQERRPLEPRSRRWRRRGRRFGEHRHGGEPPRQQEGAPASSASSFEILPGESLAKYSHTAQEPEAEEDFPPEADGVEGGENLELTEAADEAVSPDSGPENVESAAALGPETDLEAGAVEEPPAPVEVGETFDQVESVKAPEPESSLGPEPRTSLWQEAAAPVEAAPSIEAAVVEIKTESECAPALSFAEAGAPEVSSTATGKPAVEAVAQAPEATLPASPEAAASAEPPAEEFPEPGQEVPETAEGAAELPLAEEAEAQAESETGSPAELPEESEQPEGEVDTAPPQEFAPALEPPRDASGAPREGTYTLREPHQRPRFAPRRGRRGRRGGGGYQGRSEVKRESRPGNNQPVQISKLLKEGQEILVQISKEPLGTKGARITSHIALPGRYLVYMPTVDHIGVSRKIVSEEERLRLRNIILEHKGSLPGGFIVRTAAQERPEEELKADLRALSNLWSEIRSKAERVKAPALIHRDLDLVQRVLRDTLTPDFKSVRVDSESEYERVLDFVNRSQPSLIGKVRLYTRDTPLFEEFGIDAEIEKALKPKVWLKSGGYIVINQTEALVAIDVNTGKYVGKTNRLEDTILKTNVDAVNEIVRQIRMRDLGGIIVVDFIDMDERKNRAKVTQALEEALRKDRAPTKVIAFHDFGLVAITRKRVKQSLERTLCERCTYCSGSGWVKSPTTISHEILAEARKMASQIDGKTMTVRVNPEVAKALKSRDGALISEIEALTHKDVIIRSDSSVHQERFEIF